MDLLIPNSWLKKFLDTKAKPKEIAKYLSLCGPSIERMKETEDGDVVYSVEVTTNRVDTASIVGIAREAAAILPNFGIAAKLKPQKENSKDYTFTKKVKYLNAKVDSKICPRFTTVLIKDVIVKDSPKEIKSLLEKVEVRPINNIVDVSNFIMHELGQPVHTFDYDKIINSEMILRESKKGESLTTLDGKSFKLEGGDIVIEDGGGRLIDLCGIMGGQNSAIDKDTKNVLLFVQTYDQHRIRKTSMGLAQRSEAAVLFEKGLDTENVKQTIISSIELIEKLSGGKSEKEILDIYPKPYKQKTISTTKTIIDGIIGINIASKEMTKYLTTLGFEVSWNGDQIKVVVPSFRANDMDIPEDIAEEIARIYGYHNLPAILMEGELPKPRVDNTFGFEMNLKQILKSLGATEIYNLSLVSKEMVSDEALKLKNPLGSDTEYLRTSLMPSLVLDIKNNPQEKGFMHIFEVANVYLQKKGDLPKENLILGGIIKKGEYRTNKGVVETILENLNINYSEKLEDKKDYLPNQRLVVSSNKEYIGEYGNLENGLFYYEFDVQKIINADRVVRKYKEFSKFPPQVEDITMSIPAKTLIGEVIHSIKSSNNYISKVELTDIFENNYTFNIEYQNPEKTLTDSEVKVIREKVISSVKSKFGITVKE